MTAFRLFIKKREPLRSRIKTVLIESRTVPFQKNQTVFQLLLQKKRKTVEISERYGKRFSNTKRLTGNFISTVRYGSRFKNSDEKRSKPSHGTVNGL